jgi:putative ABC transport system permease protein
MFDTLRQDFRFALRGLLRQPGFAAVAIATLALGLGASAAIFTVFRAVLLAPLPYAEPDRRVMVWSRWTGWDKTWVSSAEVRDYRARARQLAAVTAWSTGQVNLTGNGDPERVGAAQVTANVLDVLGAAPLAGRGFRPGEDAAGDGAAVVLIGHGLWQRRFGGDSSVVGRLIQIDGRSMEVIGVMPQGFRLPTDFREDFAEPSELWTPLVLDADPDNRGNHGLYAAALLASGATAASANAELKAITTAFTREGLYPAAMRFEAVAVTFVDEILAPVKPALWLVGVATILLLLIACANVANLLLARAESRRKELALRTALGAGRLRLLRPLLAETTLLSLAGAGLGLVIAFGGTRLLAGANIAAIPRAADADVDLPVLGFSLALALLTAFVCGLVPALRASQVDLADTLKDGAQNVTAGAGRQRMRSALVVAEMALAVVLLVSAGLALRSLWALRQVELGFSPERVLTLRVALPQVGYEEPVQVESFYQRLLGRVRTLPGVEAAGAVRSLPLAATIGDWGLDIEGFVETPGNNAKGDWQVSTDGALEALGERLIAGRAFTTADRADTLPVALVNETMAKKYWADGNPIGRRIRMGSPTRPWITVVGIVADQQHNGLGAAVKEKFYRPHAQFSQVTGFAPRGMTLVVKTSGEPLQALPAIRHALADVDRSVPIAAPRPMSDVVSGAIAAPRFTGWLLGLFAVTALTLAAIGIYGVLSYLVSQRTREIGIRVAVGAGPGEVLRLVVSRGLALALAGVVIGVVVAFAASRVMETLLFGVEPRDPMTFIGVPVVLTLVALAASVVPAIRAARVDPIVALRTE